MYSSGSMVHVVLKDLIFLLIFFPTSIVLAADSTTTRPESKVIILDPDINEYMMVLGGPPETVTMRSGHVVLASGESVGKHTTGTFEELVVVFEGKGKMQITDGATLLLEAGSVAYCPPHTEHDVINTGPGRLRYLYIVAMAQQ